MRLLDVKVPHRHRLGGCAPPAFFACFSFLLLAPSGDSATLRGSVSDSQGRALARVSVSVAPAQPGGSSSAAVLTDSAGLFAFGPLAPGAYLISAQKRGYASAKYGQPDWNLPGTPILLAADSGFFAGIQMRRLAAISGVVTDENGVGLPDQTVHVFQTTPRLRMVAAALTDDRGHYRAAGLEPGRYLVRTAPAMLEAGRGLLPTFHEQTTTARDARSVQVHLDEEHSDANIVPMPGRLSSIRGQISGIGAASVTLFTDTGKRDAALGPGGSFSFEQLAPGPYDLLAEAPGAVPRSAWRRLSLGGEDAFVSLQLLASPQVSARCRDKHGKPLDNLFISIFLRRKDLTQETPSRLLCGETAHFSPGDWDVVAAPPSSFYIVALTPELTLRPGDKHEIEMEASSKPASLSGQVLTSDGQPAIGAPVVLNPLDPSLRSLLGGPRTTRTDHQGRYRFDGLPPGDYEAVLSTPKPVNLSEGQQLTLDMVL